MFRVLGEGAATEYHNIFQPKDAMVEVGQIDQGDNQLRLQDNGSLQDRAGLVKAPSPLQQDPEIGDRLGIIRG